MLFSYSSMLHPYLLPSYTQEAELPLRRMCQRNVRMLSSVCLLFVAYGMDHGEGGGIEDSIMHFEHAACLIRTAPMRLTAAIIIEAALLGCRARRHFNLTQHNVNATYRPTRQDFPVGRNPPSLCASPFQGLLTRKMEVVMPATSRVSAEARSSLAWGRWRRLRIRLGWRCLSFWRAFSGDYVDPRGPYLLWDRDARS